MNRRLLSSIIGSLTLLSCSRNAPPGASPDEGSAGSTATAVAPRLVQAVQGENHFRAIRQVTFGGENAEAYFSNDGQWLTLQSTRDGHPCDQQYVDRKSTRLNSSH